MNNKKLHVIIEETIKADGPLNHEKTTVTHSTQEINDQMPKNEVIDFLIKALTKDFEKYAELDENMQKMRENLESNTFVVMNFDRLKPNFASYVKYTVTIILSNI